MYNPWIILSFLVIAALGGGLYALHLRRLKDAKKRIKENIEKFTLKAAERPLVADFDKIIGDPIPFQVLGKRHFLNPITMKEFAISADAMAQIMDKLVDPMALKDFSVDRLLKMYLGVISSVCDTITMDDLNRMSQAQARALLQLVYDHITGRITEDPNQKKN